MRWIIVLLVLIAAPLLTGCTLLPAQQEALDQSVRDADTFVDIIPDVLDPELTDTEITIIMATLNSHALRLHWLRDSFKEGTEDARDAE